MGYSLYAGWRDLGESRGTGSLAAARPMAGLVSRGGDSRRWGPAGPPQLSRRQRFNLREVNTKLNQIQVVVPEPAAAPRRRAGSGVQRWLRPAAPASPILHAVTVGRQAQLVFAASTRRPASDVGHLWAESTLAISLAGRDKKEE